MKHFLAFLAFTVTLSTSGAFASIPTGLQYSADKLIHHKESNTVDLIRNAKITQGGKEMTGEKILLDLKTGIAKSEGSSTFKSCGMTVDFSAQAHSIRATTCQQ